MRTPVRDDRPSRGGALKLASVGLFVLIAVAIIGLPHLLIWSLNELFDLALAHDAWNWLAALVLAGFMSSGGGSRR